MCTSNKRRLTELVSVTAASHKGASSHEMPSTLIIRKIKFPFISFFLYRLQDTKEERQVVRKPDLNQATQVLTVNLIEQMQFFISWLWLQAIYITGRLFSNISDSQISEAATDLSERKQPCPTALAVHVSRFSKEKCGEWSKQYHEWCHCKISSSIF